MSKTLITVIGLVVSVGVVALGIVLVALPILVQSLGVDAQTASVANANAAYQAQVDHLRDQEEHLDQIDASVAALREQIPGTGQFDDVFEVVALAAAASDVSITSVAAGSQAPFRPRSGVGDSSTAAPAPESTEATDSPDPIDVAGQADSAGRQQAEFAIDVIAPDIGHLTAFLDALRTGPRLLNSITVTSTETAEGVNGHVTALTFVDSEG